jgi:hypothetical protein
MGLPGLTEEARARLNWKVSSPCLTFRLAAWAADRDADGADGLTLPQLTRGQAITATESLRVESFEHILLGQHILNLDPERLLDQHISKTVGGPDLLIVEPQERLVSD